VVSKFEDAELFDEPADNACLPPFVFAEKVKWGEGDCGVTRPLTGVAAAISGVTQALNALIELQTDGPRQGRL